MKLCISIVFACLVSLKIVSAQNIVVQDEIKHSIHQQNIGKIVFLSQTKAIEETVLNDFIKTFNLKEDKLLDARFFLENSLTNYLHILDQSMSEEQLVKNGNFQFRFYVNNKLIYTENLPIGAGTQKSKNQWTTFRIPLVSTNNEDSWGRFLWNRFYYANGGEDALFGGKHKLKIEIRPYLKSVNGIQSGSLIAEGEVDFETPVIHVSQQQVSIKPIQADSIWNISQDLFDTKKIEELKRRVLQNRFKEITSFVVIKDGKLLLEEYFNGADRNTLHDTRSVGKSFASTLTGMAISDGYLIDENQLLNQFYDLKNYDNYSTKKDSITLKHLLTMSSAFEGSDDNPDSPGNEENMYPTDNWVNFTLDLPISLEKNNAKQWDYFTAGVVLIGDVLNKKIPEGLEIYADTKLFKPLNIQYYQWQYTPQKVVSTAGGLRLRSLDLAKYGQLYHNKGKWNGKQLVSQSWIEKTLTNYFPNNDSNKGYGYLFWRETFEIAGVTYEAYACSGNGGNKIYIFQNLPLVIVLTAKAYNEPYAHRQAYKILNDYLLPAVLNL